MDKLIFIIRWLPTIIFFLGLIIPTLVGLKRGYRKSMILFTNSLVLVVILTVLYIILVKTNFGDTLVLKIIEIFTGGEGSLAKALNIETDTRSFKELFVLYLSVYLKDISPVADLASLIQGNALYIETLVSFIYHLLFALIFYIIYYVFDFILYLGYLLFKSNYRFKKKENKKFLENETYSTFQHNSLGGFLVGLGRGIIKSFVQLTFIGSFLFILSGDNGLGTLKNLDLENNDANNIYSIYQEIDHYSDHGVFKYMSIFEDNDGVPIYLQIPDLILSGESTKKGETQEINVRKDLANFTLFAKTIVKTVSEEDSETISGFINGDVSSSEVLTKFYSLFDEPSFQAELISAIDSFPESNFSVSLLLSVSDSIISYINLSEVGIPDEYIEPINILFKDGYLAESIEEEQLIKEYNKTAETKITFETIKASDILNKDDLLTILKMGFSVIPEITSEDFDYTDVSNTLIPLFEKTIEPISNLSIFKENKSMNVCIARVFKWAENTILSDESILNNNSSDGGTVTTLSKRTTSVSNQEKVRIDEYVSEVNNDFDWFTEVDSIFNIIEIFPKIYTIYNECESSDILTKVLYVLNYKDDEIDVLDTIDFIFDYLADSKVIGETLGTKFFTETLETYLKAFLGDSYEIPSSLTFNNEYDESGNLVQYGELYNIFGVTKILLKQSQTSTTENNLLNYILSLINKTDDAASSDESSTDTPEKTSYRILEDNDEEEDDESSSSSNVILDIIPLIIEVLEEKDENDHNILYYLFESEFIRSVISQLIVTYASSYIYVPNSAKETVNGEYVNIIKKDELNLVFNTILDLKDDLLNILTTFTSTTSDDENYLTNLLPLISDIFTSDKYEGLRSSKILQSSIGNKIIELKSSIPLLVFPSKLNVADNWASDASNKSEILKLIDSFDILGLNFETLFSLINQSSGDDEEETTQSMSYKKKIDEENDEDPLKSLVSSIVEKLFSLSDSDIETVFNSDIIHYTISSILDGGLSSIDGMKNIEIVIPSSATEYLEDGDSLERLITTDEFKLLIRSFGILNIRSLDDFSNIEGKINELLSTIILNKETIFSSTIISTTIIPILYSKLTTIESLVIPDSLKCYASLEKLESYSIQNPWYSEINSLLNIIKVLYNIESADTTITIEDLSTIYEKAQDLLFGDDQTYENTKTNLNLLCNSMIVSTTMTSVIDSKLTSLIDKSILDKAKTQDMYKEEELLSIFKFLYDNNLSITSFNGDDLPENIKLDIDLESDNEYILIRSIITNLIEKKISIHPLAYESSSFKILTKTETESLINLFINSDKTLSIPDDFAPEDYTIGEVYDIVGRGSCNSYVVLGIISTVIKNINTLKIPVTAVDSYDYITHDEFKKLMNSLIKINLDNESKTIIDSIPSTFDQSLIDSKIFESLIINATVTYNLNFGDNYGIEALYANRVNNINGGYIGLLSLSDITAFTSDFLPKDENGIPNITLQNINNLTTEQKNILLRSSFVRVYISYVLVEQYHEFLSSDLSPIDLDEKITKIYRFNNFNSPVETYVFTSTEIKTLLTKLLSTTD